jgi:hypothetical protein
MQFDYRNKISIANHSRVCRLDDNYKLPTISKWKFIKKEIALPFDQKFRE